MRLLYGTNRLILLPRNHGHYLPGISVLQEINVIQLQGAPKEVHVTHKMNFEMCQMARSSGITGVSLLSLVSLRKSLKFHIFCTSDASHVQNHLRQTGLGKGLFFLMMWIVTVFFWQAQ